LTPLAARMSASVYRCAVGTTAAVISGHVIGFRFYRGLEYAVGFCLLLILIGLMAVEGSHTFITRWGAFAR